MISVPLPHASLLNFTPKMLWRRMNQGRGEGWKRNILHHCGLYTKLGLGSKTKSFIISLHSDEISVKSINLGSAHWKRIYAADVLSIQHHLSLLDTFPIVSDALGRLTEQHERKEGTTNIYWRPTKCQVCQLHVRHLKELYLIHLWSPVLGT